MNNKYLLEIGAEELPARLINSALEQLGDSTRKVLENERIKYENIELYATPRRLVLIIDGLNEKQDTIEETVKGPAKRIAYDNQGNPTKALEGFMKGQGIELEQISIREHNSEEYIYGNVIKEGKHTEMVLAENMANIIKSIVFPKSMKWGGKNLRFARPIRWIVSLFNDRIVSFDLEGIPVGNRTNGHRFLGRKNIEIKSVDEYFDVLKDNYCIVDQKEKKRDYKIRFGKTSQGERWKRIIR